MNCKLSAEQRISKDLNRFGPQLFISYCTTEQINSPSATISRVENDSHVDKTHKYNNMT